MKSRSLHAHRFKALSLLLLTLFLARSGGLEAQQPSLQDGDLFVGAGQYGADAGNIARIRNGIAVTYCEPGTDYFFTPHEVMVDSQGRVVFVARLGPVASYGFGLFRCDSMGAAPVMLAGFSGTVVNTNLPNDPFPGEIFSAVTALHLAPRRAMTIDDDGNNGLPQLGTIDAYVMAVATVNPMTSVASWKSIRYHPADGTWDLGPEPVPHNNLNACDMVYHAGSTYSVYDGVLRKEKTPLQVGVSGTAHGLHYMLSLSLFGGRKEVANIITDAGTGYVDSGCSSHDGISDGMPLYGGTFTPMSGFHNVVYDESGGFGLVIATDYGGLAPYLTNVSDALLNDDSSDDKAQYFHDNYLGCAAVPSLKYQRILPAYSSDPTLYPWQANGVPSQYGSLVSSSQGVMGTQPGIPGRVFHMVSGDHVETVNTTLWNPQGIGAYPSQVSAGTGMTLIIRLDSPVNVLITDSRGRRIGVDPITGLAVNDFGEDGFDSGPGEPRIYAIKNPAPGPYLTQVIGTGNGPFTINVYSADLTQANGNRIQSGGVVTIGSSENRFFTLATDAAIAFLAGPVPPSFGSIQQAADGSVTLDINNMPGLGFTLQVSGDLLNWTTLASPVPGTNPFEFTDTAATGEAQRFYRVFYP